MDHFKASDQVANSPDSAVASVVSILVVGEEGHSLRWITKRLEERQCRVDARAPAAVGEVPVRAEEFDAAVVAVDPGQGRGLRVVRELRMGCPCASVVTVAESVSAEIIDEAIGLGVADILVRTVDPATLHAAVMRAAATTERWRRQLRAMDISRCSGGTSRPFVDVHGCLDQLAARGKLTRREQDVLHMMLRGQRIEEIAARLHISENTVKFHVRNVLRKLELRSRSELLRLLVD